MRYFAVFLTVLPIFGVISIDKFEMPEFFEINVNREHPEEIYKAFEDFKTKYHRKYKDESEAQQRFNNFVKSYNSVNALNAKSAERGLDTKFAINKFADLSSQEFSGRLSHTPPNNTGIPVLDLSKPFFRATETNKTRHKRRSTRYPDYFDLRTEKVNGRYIVGPVKDQGECACCWGFAVAGLVETVNAVSKGRFTSLSDQELCDCGTEGTPGCKGGSLDLGVQYVKRYGLAAEEDYPYDQARAYSTGQCHSRRTDRVVKARSFNYVGINPRKAEKQIIQVLTEWKVPVAVYFKVGEQFKQYGKGVIVDDDCRSAKNWHAGVIVGYDTIQDNRGRSYNYWILKNSWEGTWGEEGYVRVIRGENWCSIEGSPMTGDMQHHDDYYY